MKIEIIFAVICFLGFTHIITADDFQNIEFTNADGITFYSSNAGKSWSKSEKPTLNLNQQEFTNADGEKYFSEDAGKTWKKIQNVNQADKKNTLTSEYSRNSKELKINYTSQNNGIATIDIYNIEGKFVTRYENVSINKGENAFTYNFTTSTNSTFIVKLTCGEGFETAKFVVN